MATGSFPAPVGQSPVIVLLDPSSESSQISPVLVQKLDLPCSFGKSGVQLAAANLHVPTDDGGYHSHLSFPVSYGLTSDLVLGNDWLAPCKPTLADDWSRILKPLQSTVDHLLPPNSWHPVKHLFLRSHPDPLTYFIIQQLLSESLKASMTTLKRVRRWHLSRRDVALMFCSVLKPLLIIMSPSQTESRVMSCCSTCSVAYVSPSLMFLLVA